MGFDRSTRLRSVTTCPHLPLTRRLAAYPDDPLGAAMYSRLGGRFLSKNDTIASVTTPGRRDHPTKVLTEPANMPSKLWYRGRNNIAVSLPILSSMQNAIPQNPPKLGCSVDARRGTAPSSSRLARPSTRQLAILRASALSDHKETSPFAPDPYLLLATHAFGREVLLRGSTFSPVLSRTMCDCYIERGGEYGDPDDERQYLLASRSLFGSHAGLDLQY
jgi:hypothetical protein